ncbi:hypothetical protein DENSPDRAFT_838529 [Dentipellis sp. KUC8613]|nr:hypothetical protein DENSPDRAFT_838529 [Dentipellis sp. KUC8613]
MWIEEGRFAVCSGALGIRVRILLDLQRRGGGAHLQQCLAASLLLYAATACEINGESEKSSRRASHVKDSGNTVVDIVVDVVISKHC